MGTSGGVDLVNLVVSIVGRTIQFLKLITCTFLDIVPGSKFSKVILVNLIVLPFGLTKFTRITPLGTVPGSKDVLDVLNLLPGTVSRLVNLVHRVHP